MKKEDQQVKNNERNVISFIFQLFLKPTSSSWVSIISCYSPLLTHSTNISLSLRFDSSGHHYYNYFMRKVSLNCQKMNFNFNNCRHHYNYRRWASTIATVIDHDDELLMCVIARRYQKKPFAHNFAYRIVMHSNVLRHLPLVVRSLTR